MILLRILLFLLGAALVVRTLFSASQTFVLPRRANDLLARITLTPSSPWTGARPYLQSSP